MAALDQIVPGPILKHGRAQALLVASILALSVVCSVSYLPAHFLDFRAFYCAGQAQLSGADPYRVHPLHECEQSLSAPLVPPMPFDETLPAPFPGFVLTLFAGLALLPFAVALFFWEAAACIALGCGVILVARVTRTSILANTIVLGFPAVVVALQDGQVTPFIGLAVAGSASLLQSGRSRLAAVASLGALLDPHVGLALVLGIFVCVRESRTLLIVGAALLVALGALFSGLPHEWEYFRAVIAAHALANVSDSMQFSATNLAFEAGIAPPLALTLGSIWYVAALAVGVFVAARLRLRLGIAAAAYVPVAFAVFGGTHTHSQQLALAIPAFLLVASRMSGWRRDFCAIVTYVAAVPWVHIAPIPWLYVVPPVLAVAFAHAMGCGRQGVRLAAGSLIGLALMMIAIVCLHTPYNVSNAHIEGNPLAEVSWQMFVVSRFAPPDYWHIIAKAPTVIAFLVFFAVAVRTALGTVAVRDG